MDNNKLLLEVELIASKSGYYRRINITIFQIGATIDIELTRVVKFLRWHFRKKTRKWNNKRKNEEKEENMKRNSLKKNCTSLFVGEGGIQ